MEVLKAIRYITWTIIGFFVGAYVFTAVVEQLEEMFSPYSDDMKGFVFYSLPAGAICGSLTGCVLALASKNRYVAASQTAFISSIIIGVLNLILGIMTIVEIDILSLLDTGMTVYALSRVAPGFVWCATLFGLSIRYAGKSS